MTVAEITGDKVPVITLNPVDDSFTVVSGINATSAKLLLQGMQVIGTLLPPPTTMLGALYRYMREADPRHFQPMNANFGLVDELGQRVKDKRAKKEEPAN